MDAYVNSVWGALATWSVNLGKSGRGNGDIARLVSAMTAYTEAYAEFYSTPPRVVDDRCEALTLQVWTQVLERHVEAKCKDYLDLALRSLLMRGRWRALPSKGGLAHALMALAVQYVEERTAVEAELDGGLELLFRDAIKLKLTTAVSEWLPPKMDAHTATLRDVAAALFGEPWCVLVYDSREADASLHRLIWSARPEFLSGRLISDVELVETALPCMEL